MMDVSNIGRVLSGNPSEACELTSGSHADVYHFEFSLKNARRDIGLRVINIRARVS